jgi:single-stranded DNA-binding protein
VLDTELSNTPKGTEVFKFSVACNRAFKQDDQLQKEVAYFYVTTRTCLEEVCGGYLKKGRELHWCFACPGRISQ